jgi:hypothetical protein
MRRSGRTTRIADNCVQVFFEFGQVTPVDHYAHTQDDVIRMNKHLVRIISRRLELEHGIKAGIMCKNNTLMKTLYWGIEDPSESDVNNHRCNKLCRPVSDGFHFYIRNTK